MSRVPHFHLVGSFEEGFKLKPCEDLEGGVDTILVDPFEPLEVCDCNGMDGPPTMYCAVIGSLNSGFTGFGPYHCIDCLTATAMVADEVDEFCILEVIEA